MALAGIMIATEIVGIVIATVIVSNIVANASFTGTNAVIAPYLSTFILMGGMSLASYIGYSAVTRK